MAAGAEQMAERAKREETAALHRKEAAEVEAAALMRAATTEAERIVADARAFENGARQAVTLLADDEAQITGRVNELRAEEKRLTDRIKTLAVKVGALEAIER